MVHYVCDTQLSRIGARKEYDKWAAEDSLLSESAEPKSCPPVLLSTSEVGGSESAFRQAPRTGKSFRFVRACVRAVIVKWK